MWKIERDILVTGVVILIIITLGYFIYNNSHSKDETRPFPFTPCNETFNYEYDGQKIAFGRLHLENDMSGRYELIVKMAKAGGTDDEKLKIELETKNYHVERGDMMEYKVTFPQGEIPRLYFVDFNKKVDCIDKEPELHEKSLICNHTTFNLALQQIAQQKSNQPKQKPITVDMISYLPGGVGGDAKEDLEDNSKDEECGIQFNNTLLTPLSKSSQYSHPWLVAVLLPDRDGNYEFHCAATLISNRHVITAAACLESIDPDDLQLVLGEQHFKGIEWGSLKGAQRIVVHPDYVNQNGAGVAVIVMYVPVTFDRSIIPICLWDEPNSLDDMSGQMGTLFGWQRYSKDGDSRQISIAIVEKWLCNPTPELMDLILLNSTFCAGRDRSSSIPCTGDIGGGFVMKRNGRWRLKGVLSKVRPDQHSCSPIFAIIFIDVAQYGDWITSVLNDNADDYDDYEEEDDDDDEEEDDDDDEDDNDNDNDDELGNSTAATV